MGVNNVTDISELIKQISECKEAGPVATISLDIQGTNNDQALIFDAGSPNSIKGAYEILVQCGDPENPITQEPFYIFLTNVDPSGKQESNIGDFKDAGGQLFRFIGIAWNEH